MDGFQKRTNMIMFVLWKKSECNMGNGLERGKAGVPGWIPEMPVA